MPFPEPRHHDPSPRASSIGARSQPALLGQRNRRCARGSRGLGGSRVWGGDSSAVQDQLIVSAVGSDMCRQECRAGSKPWESMLGCDGPWIL